MAINESIWGAPETWETYTYSSGYTPAEIKTPASARYDYNKVYTLDLIELNDIDLSPCFWGMGKGSMFAQPQYISAHYDGDLSNPVLTVTPITQQAARDKPLLFAVGAPSNTTVSPRYDRRYKPDRTTPPNTYNYTQRLITSFNYQKIVAVPWIYAENDNHSGTWYPLKSYIDNYATRQNDYHYIKTMGLAYYMGAKGERAGVSVYRGGILPFTVNAYDGFTGTYNDRMFWARGSGMDFLTISSASSTSSAQSNNIFATLNDGYGNQYSTPDASVATAETGFRYKYCLATSTSDTSTPPIYYFNPNDELWEYACLRSNSWRVDVFIDAVNNSADDVRDYFMKQTAFFGLPFLYDDVYYNSGIGDTGIYLPVFDDDGVTTGDYVEGAGALELPNAEWTDGRSSGYDPNRPPTPESGDYGDLNNLGHNRYMGKGLNVYVMPAANYIHNFLPALNGLYENKTPDDWTIDFQGENPSSYIVSAFNTFFAVPTQGISTNIMLGVVDTGISADVYDRGKPQSETFTYGTRRIEPLYYDFRDYAPYTNIELYLPLCGTIPLETAYVMGHDITINYWYDITTMSCTACVYRDNLLYKTLDGSLGVPAPLLASDMGNYQNQIKQLENAKTQNNMRIATSALSLTAGIAAAVASGGTAIVPEVMGIAGGLAGMSKAIETANEIEYKIDHAAPSISTTGASESQNNMCVGQLIPKLIIKRPVMLPNKNDAIYSKTVGNACCINNSVGNNNGLIKCSNVDLSGITATAAEISAIQNLLTSGVYV